MANRKVLHPFRSWLKAEHLEDRCTPSAALSVDPTSYAADRVLVTLSPTSRDANLTRVASSPLTAGVQRLGFDTYQVALKAGVSPAQAVTYFSGASGVVLAEVDYAVGVQMTPNDPSYGSLWGMNSGSDYDIDAPEAWDTARGTGQTVVAVIDSGVDYNHPDLAANMWRNPGETAGDGVDNDGNGIVDDVYGADFANNDGDPMDDNNHGTHVAGTIGAVGDNGVGVTGVAWKTRIMALKFLSSSGSGYTSNAVRAVDYAVAKGAKVLNNSWGGGGYSSTLNSAIQNARNAGVIFVAAAGNSASNNDSTPTYPANYAVDNVVSVAATTSGGGLASYSNYGATTVTLGAPGSGILSTVPGGGYASYSGTSMASPHVAGALAVLWDANPSLSYDQVIQKLKSAVDPLASLAGRTVTGGQLNLQKMLAGSSPPPASPPPPSDNIGARITGSTFSGNTSGTFDRVRLSFNEAITASSFSAADVTLKRPDGTNVTVSSVTPVSGTTNQFDVTFVSQSVGGTYTVTTGPQVMDSAGNPMDQNQNTVNGENPGDLYSGSASLSSSQQTFNASGLPLAIRDLQTTTVTINVPSGSSIGSLPITDIDVGLTLTHSATKDLVITLTSPSGRTVTLFNKRGGAGDNLTGTVFDDEAGTLIANGKAPFTGRFKPEQLLSMFDGVSAVGDWTLQIQDTGRRDSGSVTAASITVTVGSAGQSVSSLGIPDGTTAAADFSSTIAPVLSVQPPDVRQPEFQDELADTTENFAPKNKPDQSLVASSAVSPAGMVGFDLIRDEQDGKPFWLS